MSNPYFIIGIVSGLISFVAYISYNILTYKGGVQPHRVTWWVWTIVAGVTLASYYSSSVTAAVLWLPCAYFLGRFITALVSIKKGVGGWTLFDRWCILLVAISLIMWWLFNSPKIALYLSIVIDFIGVLPTIKKTILAHVTEKFIPWSIFLIGSIVNLFAITQWNSFVAISYPIYVLLVNAIMVGLVVIMRKQSVGKI